jgi:hypothetical protein
MLQTEAVSDELNSVEISITPVVKTKTLSADDKEVELKRDVRYTGTLRAYHVDADAAAAIFGFTKDANSNIVEVMNAAKKSFCIFFEAGTGKEVKYQKYLYDVKFDTPNFSFATDAGEETANLEITFTGEFVVIGGKQVRGVTVYSGKTGFVADEPTTVYAEAAGA